MRSIEYFANFGLGKSVTIKVPNLYNLIFSKSCLRNPFPTSNSSMRMAILYITFFSIPSQVFKKIVLFITVIVAAFHSWWAWADKGEQYETMDISSVCMKQTNHHISRYGMAKEIFYLRSIPQYTCSPPAPLAYSLNASPLPVRPYSSLIRNLIPFKPRNRFPSLGGIVKMLISHCEALLQRVELWLEPYRCANSGAACFLS